MRIAILSDIHSNLEALKTAFGIIDNASPDAVLCLGDIVGYGPNPNECIEIIRSKCSAVIKGNHDEAVTLETDAEKFNPFAVEAVRWTQEHLEPGNMDYLVQLPFYNIMDDLFFVHGSPSNPEQWDYIFTPYEASGHFQSFMQKICFIGHTHIPNVYSEHENSNEIRLNQRYIINVGSVGQPRDGDNRLSFGIFDSELWSYKNIRSEYNAKYTASKIREAGLPGFLADRLLMGR